MWPIATDVARSLVCVPVCLLSTRLNCAKTIEPIEMPFGGVTQMGPRNHVLDEGPDPTNPFAAARGDKTAMRPVAKLL